MRTYNTRYIKKASPIYAWLPVLKANDGIRLWDGTKYGPFSIGRWHLHPVYAFNSHSMADIRARMHPRGMVVEVRVRGHLRTAQSSRYEPVIMGDEFILPRRSFKSEPQGKRTEVVRPTKGRR